MTDDATELAVKLLDDEWWQGKLRRREAAKRRRDALGPDGRAWEDYAKRWPQMWK